MAEKIKRPLIATFLDTSKAAEYSSATWTRVGLNVTEASTEYNPQTETEQDIISNSATTDITGYQPSMPVSQQCTKGDPIFEFITKLRRNRAILSEAHTWLLNVDLWDETSGKYVAEVQEVSISVETYGGAGGETPVQDFTINYIGDPIKGTVTMAGAVPTFVAGATTVEP